ncbi:MAG: MFS transporter [Rhodospirillaceae bacterium]|nr:MFS transporter [Rhodospirillaceae bacterium]
MSGATHATLSAWGRFIGGNFRFLSFGFGINVFISVGQTFYISLFNDSFQTALGLNHGQIAAIYGGSLMLGALLTMQLGRIYDRFDLRVICTILVLLMAACAAVMAMVDSPWMLFVGMFGVRFFGGGLLGLGAQASMARYFETDRGKAASIANAGHTVGFGIFPLIGALLIEAVGWRGAWWAVTVAALVLLLPLIHLQLVGHGERHARYVQRMAELAAKPSDTAVRHYRLAEMLRDGRFYMLLPGILAVPAIMFTFQFHQLELVHEKGWSVTVFAAGYVVFSVVSFLGNLLAGEYVDRHGTRALLRWYLLPMIPAMFFVALSDDPIAIPIYMAGTGLTFGCALVMNVTLYAELYGSRHIGAIRGFTVAMNTLIAAGGMAGVGWLIDAGISISQQAFACGVITVFSALLLVLVAPRLPGRRR